MTYGPGKYDRLATLVREQTGADVVALIVIGGNRGAGFSVQMLTDDLDPRPKITALARTLRSMAEQLEHDAKAGA
jgi:hypothetical protein